MNMGANLGRSKALEAQYRLRGRQKAWTVQHLRTCDHSSGCHRRQPSGCSQDRDSLLGGGQLSSEVSGRCLAREEGRKGKRQHVIGTIAQSTVPGLGGGRRIFEEDDGCPPSAGGALWTDKLWLMRRRGPGCNRARGAVKPTPPAPCLASFTSTAPWRGRSSGSPRAACRPCRSVALSASLAAISIAARDGGSTSTASHVGHTHGDGIGCWRAAPLPAAAKQ